MEVVISTIKTLCSEKKEIQKAMLFGSRVRSDFKPESDYDFAFFASIECDLSSFFAKVIDNNPSLKKLDLVHFEKASSELQQSILQEGKLIYER